MNGIKEEILLYCERRSYGLALFDLHEKDSDRYPEVVFFGILSNQNFQTGLWYSCSSKAFERMLKTAEIIKDRVTIRGTDEKFSYLKEARYDPYFFETLPTYHHDKSFEKDVYDSAEIFYTGDGSANRIFCDKEGKDEKSAPDIWFDYGCGNHAVTSEIAQGLESRRAGNEVIVISHWDMDHSNCLEYIKKPVSELIAVDMMPKTVKRRRMAIHLSSLGITMRTFGFGSKKGLLQRSTQTFSNVEIWMPEKNKTRNESSYVMFAQNKDSLILAGDQNYLPICNSITPSATSNFLLPHHGGFAGRQPTNLCHYITGVNAVSCSSEKHKRNRGSISWSIIKSSRLAFTYNHRPSIIINF